VAAERIAPGAIKLLEHALSLIDNAYVRKTFRYRIYPTPLQKRVMNQTLEECRWLYNRLLEERELAWEACGATISLYDQQNHRPALKSERPSLTDRRCCRRTG
jgi:transposase